MQDDIFWFEKVFVCLSYEMEANQSSVTVTLNYGALTCAAEALATLLASALVKATLLAPVSHSLRILPPPKTILFLSLKASVLKEPKFKAFSQDLTLCLSFESSLGFFLFFFMLFVFSSKFLRSNQSWKNFRSFVDMGISNMLICATEL